MTLKIDARQKPEYAVVEFDYADLPAGTFVPLVKLPLGAIVVEGVTLVTEASNAGTTDVLDIGTAASPAAYHNDLNFKAAARTAFTTLPALPAVGAASTIGITRTPAGTAATAGKGVLVVGYVTIGNACGTYG